MDGLGTFLTTDEKMKLDKDDGSVYKQYIMSEKPQ